MICWQFVERFQGLLVGVVGFVGVIITLLFNAHQARRQREDERSHERDSLRTALIAELELIRGALRRNSEEPDPEAPKGALVPIHAMDDAYRSFTHRIGLLTEIEVAKVMTAYLSLRTGYAKLHIIGEPVPGNPHHIHVKAERAGALAGMLRNLIPPVDEAIAAMHTARQTAKRVREGL